MLNQNLLPLISELRRFTDNLLIIFLPSFLITNIENRNISLDTSNFVHFLSNIIK